MILGGYAELFLAAATVGATATLALSLKEQDEKLALLGLLVALSCATLKNTGFVFSSCIFIGYTTCLAIRRGFGKRVILFATVMGVSGALFILTPPSLTMTFEMGNRQLILELGNAHFNTSQTSSSAFFIIQALLLPPPDPCTANGSWSPKVEARRSRSCQLFDAVADQRHYFANVMRFPIN